MTFRIVAGQGRDELLGPKTGRTFDAEPYREFLNDAGDGESIAVEINPNVKRSEMLRFSRVARTFDTRLEWLPSSDPAEVAFDVKAEQSRGRYRPRENTDVVASE